MNPYEEIMDSIHKIRKEHQINNIFNFVSDQIKISKVTDHYDVFHSLITGNGQTMTMTYILDCSDKKFLPSQISYYVCKR